MGELSVRLRTVLGVLPVALTRLGRTAVGDSGGWEWLPPAVPWLFAAATALAVGLLSFNLVDSGRDYPMLIAAAGAMVGGIVLFGTTSALRGGAGLFMRGLAAAAGALMGGVIAFVLSDAIASTPLGFAVVAGVLVGAVVLGWRLQIAHSAHEAAKSIGFVPALIWILLLLAAIPAIQAGAEIIITRASVPAFVERQVGFSSSLVEIQGLAMLPPYPAESPLDPETGGPAAGAFRWFPLRAELSDRRIALVRSELDGAALDRREVVARISSAIDRQGTLGLLAGRGVEVPVGSVGAPGLQALSGEAVANASEIQSIGSVDGLAGLADGTVVRITLDFPGDAVAACFLAADCDARRLAQGTGPWLHLAHDPSSGAPVVVQLSYPPTVAPMHAYGRQTSDDAAVGRFLDGPQVRHLLGWAQVLRGAIIDQDLNLPVDRLWLGPILFVGLAVLLALGLWSGYPVFRATHPASGRWTARPDGAGSSGPIEAVASGYVAPPGRSPIDLDEARATLAVTDGETVLSLVDREPPLQVTIPRALGALSGMQAGELRYLTRRRPALEVGWYGSQVLLIFEDEARRDAAAAMLSGAG